MSPLRVVKVIPFFAPATRFGGVVSQAEAVCRALAARGHRVRVVTTDNGVDPAVDSGIVPARWTERDGYEVYYAPTRPRHRVAPYPSPAMRPALEQALAEADVCALNVGLTLANRLAARVAAKCGVPFVYNAEGALCPTRLAMKRWRKRVFLRAVERPLLARAAACQAVTAKEVEDLVGQGVPRDRIHLIPNGIDAFEPVGPENAAAFRERLRVAPAAKLVLYLGRLHAVKGLDRLVEAFTRLPATDARLVIAGPDEDGTGRRIAAAVRASGAGDRITFTDHLEGDDKVAALTAADLFVLTSDSEGLPNAVLEALAAGIPCLLTEHCNVPDVAVAGAGRVVAPTTGAVHAALHDLLTDDAALRRMREPARRLAAETFALDRVVDRLEELYLSIR